MKKDIINKNNLQISINKTEMNNEEILNYYYKFLLKFKMKLLLYKIFYIIK